MRRRRTADEITRLLKEADRDLAKGLTVSDICRKHGIGQSMYYRWREKPTPPRSTPIAGAVSWRSRSIGSRSWSPSCSWTKRCSRTLQKKSGEPGPAASRRRLLERALWDLAAADLSRPGAVSLGAAIPSEAPLRRTGIESGDQTAGPSTSAFWIPMIHALLLRRGWTINIKRVRRLWIDLGLKRPVRLRKARKLGPKPGSSANSCVNQPARFKNDVWTCDFIHDRTADGRPLKWLTLVDEYTRECLVLHAATSISGPTFGGSWQG